MKAPPPCRPKINMPVKSSTTQVVAAAIPNNGAIKRLNKEKNEDLIMASGIIGECHGTAPLSGKRID